MATADRYEIDIVTSGAQRNVESLEKSLKGLASTGQGVTTALSGLFTAATVKSFTDLADAATNLQNKLNLVKQQGQTSTDVFNLMAKTAMTLGSPLEDVGNLFFRIANSTKDLGLAQTTQLRVTELLSKAFQTNGLSAAEAGSAMTQFSQALAKGTLNGDELNSILENAPPIAQAIADKFGVTTGALRTLGSQGKITSKDIIDAMLAAGNSIDKDFAQRIPTVENAWNRFKTTLTLTVADFDKNTQASARVSEAILILANAVIKVADFIKEWGGVIKYVVELFSAIMAFSAVGKVLSIAGAAITGFFTAIKSGFGLVKDVTVVTGKLITRGGELATAVGGWGKVFGAFGPRVAEVGKYFAQLAGTVATGLGLEEFFDSDPVEKTNELIKENNTLLGLDNVEASNKAKEASKARSEQDLKGAEITRKALTDITQAYADFNATFANQTAAIGLGEQQSNLLNAQLEAAQKYSDAVKKIKEDMLQSGLAGSAQEQEAIKKLTETYSIEIAKLPELAAAREQATRALNFDTDAIRTRITLENDLQKIQDDIAKSTMTEIEQKYYDIEAAAKASAKAAIEAEEARRKEKLDPAEVQAYYAEHMKGVEAMKLAQEQSYQASRSFETGWRQAFNAYSSEATNAANQAKQIFTTVTKGMEDLIVNFVKTGKFQWKDFLSSIAEMIIRSGIQKLIAEAFGGITGFGGSNGGGGLGLGNIISGIFGGGGGNVVQPSNPKPSGGGGGGGWGEAIINAVGGSVIGSIGNSIGGWLGDIGSAIGDLFGFANGGIIPHNKPVIVGEKGPELLMGASGSRVIPNNQLAGVTNVNYTIHAVDARSFKQMIAADPSFIYAVSQQGARTIPGRF